jgi:hypothetical protein
MGIASRGGRKVAARATTAGWVGEDKEEREKEKLI